MGAFLEKPRTDKTNESGCGAGLRYAVASMQGWRVDMEDAHISRTDLPEPWVDWAFFAVFDGHAGSKVARHSASKLLEEVLDTVEMQQLANDLKSIPNRLASYLLISIFLLHDILSNENERSGSTAVCALIAPSHIFVGNLGDSRALLSRSNTVFFATEDHKPYLPKERERIVNAGGSVMIHRVNGSLAVSRALGDFEYKSVDGLGPCEQLVSPEPDVYAVRREFLQPLLNDEFLILACDGIFDVMNNQELCDFVRSRLKVTSCLTTICNQILDACLSKGSRDNMSVILITLPGAPQVSHEKELEEVLCDRIQRKLSCFDDHRLIFATSTIVFCRHRRAL
ncbi:unnamed protein product [Soboliphyme baturini]|uniref:PPM-type phosphatase domain-containing protein n=1 Tax=Soboliphyme baturini TaxID=241478 RepID=A0A183IHT1_9BILA|nr:unnamed protein product [Soboliphyme baturini]